MGGGRGIAIPTTRRVFAYDENKHKVPAPVLVVIDIGHVALLRAVSYSAKTAP